VKEENWKGNPQKKIVVNYSFIIFLTLIKQLNLLYYVQLFSLCFDSGCNKYTGSAVKADKSKVMSKIEKSTS